MTTPTRILLLLGSLLAIVGCSPTVREGAPAPIIGPGGVAPSSPAGAGSVAVTPLEAPKIQTVEQTPIQTYRRPAAPEAAQPVAVDSGSAAEPEKPVGGSQQVAMATPSRPMSKAVKTLLQQAELQRSAGDLTGAAATLERALRIEPDSAYVWNRLAHVRAEQGQAGLAGELAAKSNAFASGDDNLKRDNDKLIARARK